MTMIEVSDVSVFLGTKKIVENTNFNAEAGQLTVIVAGQMGRAKQR